MIQNERIAYLTETVLSNKATEEEFAELILLLQKASPEELHPQMEALLNARQNTVPAEKVPENWEGIVDRVLSIDKQTTVKKIGFQQRFRWVAAAIFLLIAAGISYYIAYQSDKKIIAPSLISKTDITPGREGAKLTLSNGRVIIVDTAKEGLLASEGRVQIFKENGKIVYKGIGEEVVYNEITTDNGRFSTAVLPDGSFVWLNAASSIRYPLQFKGDERRISMKGQVSFRVVHNPQMPFKVEAAGQVIEDIGTEFDINAYSDEPSIKTTLIEGSASISTATQKQVLKPGQQAATIKGNDAIKITNDINIENVIAWRNGKFKFEDADIYSVMRQVARWYDLSIVYEGTMTNDTFNGGTFRNENLTEVLKVLELNGSVHFKMEGKKLMVRP